MKMPALLLSEYPIDATRPIESIDDLKNHLVHASMVELSTIPLYLYAAYSIQSSNYSQWSPGMSAFRAIRSVVIEEMLHLCLARNLLVAIGGDVTFYDEKFVFVYPNDMLHHTPPLQLRLERASKALMERVFMPLEKPKDPGAKPEPDYYHTLGQFYAAIEQGFEYLDPHQRDELWKDPHTALQYQRAYWNDDGGGAPIVVKDFATAKTAIQTIVEQGEGEAATSAAAEQYDEEHVPLSFTKPVAGLDELSHYAKFERIAKGIDGIGDVYPVPENPHRDQYSGPVKALATLFDAAYSYVLCMIDAIYTTPRESSGSAGETSERYGLERTFIAAMGGLLYPIGDLLVRQPLPDVDGQPRHAAPCFGFYEFDRTKTYKEQLTDLCEAVLGDYPSLGGDDGVRQLIGRLPSVGPQPLTAVG